MIARHRNVVTSRHCNVVVQQSSIQSWPPLAFEFCVFDFGCTVDVETLCASNFGYAVDTEKLCASNFGCTVDTEKLCASNFGCAVDAETGRGRRPLSR